MIHQKLKEVLLIDDDNILNFVNCRLFNKIGFSRVVCSQNGRQALDYMIKNYTAQEENHEKRTVLVLLDLNMPYMDGWEFLEAFRDVKHRFISQIKIFILTSSFNPDDLERSKSYKEVVDYINKPLSPERISQILETYV